MLKRLLLVLILLGIVFGGIFAWKYRQMQQMEAQMAQPRPPAVVASTEVRAEVWEPYLFSVGSLVASEGVEVTNEIPGQISQISFRSGQQVRKGDLLLRLEDSVDRADLDGLIAERRLAELQFERMERLYKQKSASRADYDEARAKLDNAQARVASKRAFIGKKQIRAPFAGQLGIRQVNLGQYLAAGSEIVLLQALDPIFVDFTLPERHFSELSEGQEVVLGVQAYPEARFEGAITALNPGVDPGTRSVRLRATLENADGRLRPGMFAEIRVKLPERQDVITLPRTAITYNPYGDSVFVIEEQDDQLVAQRRQVETGAVREGRVEILSGVEVGERVVRAGHQKLRNGQSISIDNTAKLDEQVETP